MPGLGLDYDSFDVFADPAADMPTIFDTLAAGFVADIEPTIPGRRRHDDARASSTSTRPRPSTPRSAAFAQAAAADVDAQPAALHRRRRRRCSGTATRGDYWAGFVDLGEYLGRLDATSSPAVAAARDALLAALDAAVARPDRHARRTPTPPA